MTPAAPVSIRIVPNTSTPTSTEIPTLTPTQIQPARIGTPLPYLDDEINWQAASQLVEVARWGMGLPQQINWSPDSKQIGIATTRGIYFFSTGSLELISSIENGTSYRSFAFSPDGSKIAAGCEDGKIQIWRMKNLRLLQTLSGHEAAVMSLAFSPSGNQLASGSWDDSVRVWRMNDVSEGDEEALPTGETLKWVFQSEGQGVRKIAFTEDGSGLMVWSRFANVQVWDLIEGVVERVLPIGETKKDSKALLEFSTGGEYIAEWKDKQVQVYTTKNAYILYSLEIGSEVYNLAFSPDGNYMAVAKDNSIRLFRMSDGMQVQEIKFSSTGSYPGLMAISPDGAKLAALGDTLRIWDFSGVELLEEVKVSVGEKRAVVSKEAGVLAAWNPLFTQVRLWRLQSVQESVMLTDTAILKDHLIPVEDVAFSPDGQFIATAADMVRIWDASQQKLLLELDASSEGMEQTFRVFNYETGETLYVPLRGKSALSSLAFSPDGKLLAAGGYDHGVHIWRMPEGLPLTSLQWGELEQKAEMNRVDKVSFSPDGLRLAAGDRDGRFVVWQVPPAPAVSETAILSFNQSIQQLVSLQMPQVEAQEGSADELCHLSIGASGQELRAAWLDRYVRFSIKDGTLIEDSPSLCGVPMLATEGTERLLRLPEAGLSLSVQEDHPSLENAAYLPDSRILITLNKGSGGSFVQVWQIDASRLQDLLTSRSFPYAYNRISLEDLLLVDQQLITAWLDGIIERRRLDDGVLLRTDSIYGGKALSAVALYPQGNYAAVATWDGQLNLWQYSGDDATDLPKIVRSFGQPETNNGTSGKIQRSTGISLVFSDDGAVLAEGTKERNIYLWRVSDGELIAALEHPSLPLQVLFSTGNGHLAVKSPDGIWLWRINELNTDGLELLPYIFPGYGMAFSPDGGTLAVASRNLGNRKIDLWNVSEFISSGHGSPIKTIPAFGSFNFSPTGEELVVSGIEVSVWNVSEGKALFTLPNPAPYSRLTFTPDGRMLVTAGWDGSIFIWTVR